MERRWESSGENIKIISKVSRVHYELKRNNLEFEEEYSKVLDQSG
jgi:hypothetical protein